MFPPAGRQRLDRTRRHALEGCGMSTIGDPRSAEAANCLPATRQTLTARSERLAWGVCVAAAVPLAGLHLWRLWEKPHYQFAPMLLAVLAYLGWKFWREDVPSWFARPESFSGFDGVEPNLFPQQAVPTITRPAILCAQLLRIGSLLCLLLAVALFSPWLGYVAFLIGLGSLVIRTTGSAVGGPLGPVWCLAWLLIPPPFELDVRLIQGLQVQTAGLASRLLDLLGQRHLLEGNILEFPGQRFFVEEACSGVQSLFSLTAVALLFCVWKRRNWLHWLLLVTAAVFWALAANVMRILAVGMVYAITGRDLASGLPHELLGYALFGLAVAMLLSTDELIGGVLGPIILPRGLATRNPFSRRWNRWVANIPAELDQLPASAGIRSAGFEAAPEIGAGAVLCRSFEYPRPLLMWSFAGLGILQLVGMAGAATTTLAVTKVRQADVVSAEALPESLRAWQRTDSKLVERARESYEGNYSRIWTYTGPEYVAFASFDYPFPGVHELTVCYAGKGWIVRNRKVHSCVWLDGTGKLCEVEMTKAGGESAYLLFVEFDGAGRPANLNSRGALYSQRLLERLSSSPLAQKFRTGTRRVTHNPDTLYQFQVFVPTFTPLSAEEKSQVHEQFMALLERLLLQWLNDKQEEPPR